MASFVPVPKWQVFDGNGLPLAGAKLETYAVGTSEDKDTYTDRTGLVVAANPIVFDSEGRSEVWLGGGLYKMILKDANDNVIWTVDGVGAGGSGTGSGAISVIATVVGSSGSLVSQDSSLVADGDAAVVLGYYAIGDGGGGTFRWDENSNTTADQGVTILPADKGVTDAGRWVRLLDEGSKINVRWYGAKGDGSYNDAPRFLAANQYCASALASLYIPAGNYNITSSSAGFVATVPVIFEPNAKLISDTTNIGEILPIIDSSDFTQHFQYSSLVAMSFPAGSTVIPQWFGDVGLGSDDIYAFHYALTSIRNGGSLFIPKGTYVVSGSITVSANQRIYGEGEGSVVQAGSGSVAWNSVGEAIFQHDTSSAVIENMEFNNFKLLDTQVGTSIDKRGITLNCKNSTIHNMTFSGFPSSVIFIGGTYGSEASSNVSIHENKFLNAGYYGNHSSIEIYNGDSIRVFNNEFVALVAVAYAAVHVMDSVGTLQKASNILIEGNRITQGRIYIAPATGASDAATGIMIKENEILVGASYAGIDIGGAGAYGPKGSILVQNNVLDVPVNGHGIKISATNHQASNYVIVNNVFHEKTPITTGYGCITLEQIPDAVPTIVEGNTFDNDAASPVGQTAINANFCTGILYGINPARKFNAPVVVSDSTLKLPGTLDLQQLNVNGDLTVVGTIFNSGLNIANRLIQGLHLGLNTPDATATTVVTISDGVCFSSVNKKLMVMDSTNFTKDLNDVWASGSGNGGRASALTFDATSWYHVFLVSDPTSPHTVDVGFDSDVNATNLLADTGSLSEYRRLGSVMVRDSTSGIYHFRQEGDEFVFTDPIGSDSTTSNGYTVLPVHLNYAPPGYRSKIEYRIAIISGASFINVMDGDGSYNYMAVAKDNGSYATPGMYTNWTDSSSNLKYALGVATPTTFNIAVKSWLDLRNQY